MDFLCGDHGFHLREADLSSFKENLLHMKIILENICKSYNGKTVLDNFSYVFSSDTPSVIEGVSGIGKTTLLKIIMGLEEQDSGRVILEGMTKEECRFAPVFQDTSLIPSVSAVKNVRLACRELSSDAVSKELTKLIPSPELNKKVRELSGGTSRRVEIVRAVLASSDVLIMDEPLTGLDEENAARTVSYIKENLRGRIFITSSHSDLFEKWCQRLYLPS